MRPTGQRSRSLAGRSSLCGERRGGLLRSGTLLPHTDVVAGVIEWLNKNAGAIQALGTVVLVGVTYYYAHLTRKISKATRESQRAHIALDVVVRKAAQFVLVVLNSGTRAAHDVRFSVESASSDVLQEALEALAPFRRGLPYVAPGRRYDYMLHRPGPFVHDVFPRDEDEADPGGWRAVVNVSYRDEDDTFKETVEINLRSMEDLAFSSFDTDGTVVAKALGGLEQKLEALNPRSPLNNLMAAPTRFCVFCRQQISTSAVKCHECGEWQEEPPLWRPGNRSDDPKTGG